MKKLKIKATKKWLFGKREKIIAEVWVEKGKVRVKAINGVIEKEILADIEPAAYGRGFRIAPSREEPGYFQNVNDPEFLKAIMYADFWSDKTYDDWHVLPVASKVVEE